MPLSTPEKYHEKNHRRGLPFGECWQCQKARTRCREKRTYLSIEEAEKAVQEIQKRERWTRGIGRYKCRWCLKWHLTSKGKATAQRTEKQRRKNLHKEELERRDTCHR